MLRRAPRGLATSCCLLTCWCVVAAAPASAGPSNQKDYCIDGGGDGVLWNWEIRVAGSPTVLASDSALSDATGTTASDIRNTLVDSINAAAGLPPWLIAHKEPLLPSPCAVGDASFYIAGQQAFDLWMTDQTTLGHPLKLVGSYNKAVDFNPLIFQVPEPSVPLMLFAGCLMLAALERGRRRSGQAVG